jgi:hypothetical protein
MAHDHWVKPSNEPLYFRYLLNNQILMDIRGGFMLLWYFLFQIKDNIDIIIIIINRGLYEFGSW